VINLLDEEEYVRWQEEKETQDKAAAYGLFRSYLETVGVKNDPTGSGIVMVPEREGSGRNPKFGDRVLIHYMMVSFGGAELANTYKSGQPYDFTLGSSDVVYGLNEALLRMKKGGKARIYIPYYLAYGKDGVAGYVGPYTHLVMDVELLDIM
jgi:FKBP-type peptidyl-prolyl cis-trans isomerase